MTNAKYTSIEKYRNVESLNYYKILRDGGKSEEEALKIIGERSRDNGRTPMQWNSEKFAGFSKIETWISSPERISSPENYKQINVAAEEKDSDSVLNFYKMLVKFCWSNFAKKIRLFKTAILTLSNVKIMMLSLTAVI